MKRQAGFTLVEIAIVLVIIGLLLGGVLKGQELIESAKVKNIAQDMRSISVAVLTYQDRFRALPGDDPGALARWGQGTCQVGNGNGLIEGQWDGGIATEAGCAWQHLRRANLMTGDPLAAPPTHADAGVFGVVSQPALAAVNNVTGSLVVCAANVRGRHVLPLDAMLDDGLIDTGAMRARTAVNAAPAPAAAVALNGVPIVDGDPFFVCMGF